MKLKSAWLVGIGVSVACADVDGERASAQNVAAAPTPEVTVCAVAGPGTALPDEVRETSGLARARGSGLFWTHNDANNPADLFALDVEGRVVQRVRVNAAAVDWEDIEAAPCPAGRCLYIGDIGDNDGARGHVTIDVLSEPGRGATAAAATSLHARYPTGPRDAESLFVAPGGDMYIVTKGRGGAVELYRYPAPQRRGEVVVLERIRELFPQPESAERVSAATMTPDGRWVAIRSYRTLYLYRAAQLLNPAAEARPVTVDLRPLGHVQGESVAMDDDGTVWLTSEAGRRGNRPVWARLTCTLPE